MLTLWPVTVVELIIPVLRGRHGQLPVRLGVAPHGPGPGRHAVCRVFPVFPAPPPTGQAGHTRHTGHAPLGVDIHYQLVRGQRARARVRLAALTRPITEFTCSLTFDYGLLYYLEKYAAVIDIILSANQRNMKKQSELKIVRSIFSNFFL